MAEKVMPGPVQDDACIREAVCIHTKKIFDSCRDKDCVEDLRFYPTQSSKAVIDRAVSIKPGTAELLDVYIDVEPVSFNRGFYTVDVRYFYRVTADAFVGAARPVCVSGLAIFDKRVILFGSESSAKVFTSDCSDGENDHLGKANLPTAVVEAVDPIILSMKLVDSCACKVCDCELCEVPSCVCSCFGSDLDFTSGGKRVYLTLGQFSIIRLERDTQLLIPVYDYCLPEKECSCGGCCDDDPCEVFRQVKFPVDEFFPPNALRSGDGYREIKGCCNH